MRSPCLRCGIMLHTGEAKVLVGLTADNLETLAAASPDRSLSKRLLCALGVIDPEREKNVRADIEQSEIEAPATPIDPNHRPEARNLCVCCNCNGHEVTDGACRFCLKPESECT